MTKSMGRWRFAAVLAVVPTMLAMPLAAQAQEGPGTQDVLNSYQAEAGPGAGVFFGDSNGSQNLTAGTAVVNTDRPIKPTDHYRVASQTKSFTAVVVLQLVDAGKVALDEPIESYLPGLVQGNGYDGNTITIRHLLQHFSGFPTDDAPNPEQSPDGTYTLEALVRDGLDNPPAAKPGEAFHYSNTNYNILGMLIEKLTGKPVREEITGRIIEPLGLSETSYPKPGDKSVPAEAVHGYSGGRVPPFFFWSEVTTNLDPSWFHAAGAMISTQQDMTKFYQALLAGKLTSPESLAEMKKTVPYPNDIGASVGLGLFSFEMSCGGASWGHNGGFPGYTSQTQVTEDGRHAALVTNTLIDSPMLIDVMNSALCG